MNFHVLYMFIPSNLHWADKANFVKPSRLLPLLDVHVRSLQMYVWYTYVVHVYESLIISVLLLQDIFIQYVVLMFYYRPSWGVWKQLYGRKCD